MRMLSRGLRVRSLLILVLFVAVSLGVGDMVLRAYRVNSYRRQAVTAAEERDRCLHFAQLSFFRGDFSGFAKQTAIAATWDDRRRLMEQAAVTGGPVYASNTRATPR
jgi:hypothetical protein